MNSCTLPDSLRIFDIYSPRAFQNTQKFEDRPSRTRVRDQNICEFSKKWFTFGKISAWNQHYIRICYKIEGSAVPVGSDHSDLDLVANPYVIRVPCICFQKWVATVLVSNSSSTGPIFKILDVLESPRPIDAENGQKCGKRPTIRDHKLATRQTSFFFSRLLERDSR